MSKLLQAAKAVRERCTGIFDTDQVTGETFDRLLDEGIASEETPLVTEVRTLREEVREALKAVAKVVSEEASREEMLVFAKTVEAEMATLKPRLTGLPQQNVSQLQMAAKEMRLKLETK